MNVQPGKTAYQIVFEGITGNGFRGDIAIDDYSMTQGACASEGKFLCLKQAIY